MERWQMNRLGFVNFWLYDTDVFPLKDGKILLRGTNGSGKSITTQSFIPYILDGDRQPSRLDPFGSKDRKMSWYLLGDPENGKEESTAYLYLEFIKPECKKFRTIGIGMNAKKGGTMKTWGFCLMDGRRVGIDFYLYRKAGSAFIPHDISRLKKELGTRNIFVEKPSEYKEMVAEHIFGIKKENINVFEQLTNILIKTRSSKLSKDNLKPAQLYNILNESLQTLSDDDLRPMADAMNKIEDTHNKIEDAEKALAEVHQLAIEYDKYNRYMLWKKASSYLDKSSQVNKAQINLEIKEKDIKNAEENKENAIHIKEQSQLKIDDLIRENESLNITDIEQQLQKRTNASNKLQYVRKKQEEKQKSIDDKNNKIKRKYSENIEVTDKIESLESEKGKLLRELSDYVQYSFPLHENYIREIKMNSEFHERSAQCRQEQAALSGRLKKISVKLTELESKREKREAAARTLYESKENTKQKNDEYVLVENEFNEEKDKIIEAFYTASHRNTEFIIDEDILEQIEVAVSAYEGQGADRNISNLLQKQRDRLYAGLQELLAKAKHQESLTKQKFEELSRQLTELKNTSDPVPERTKERELYRSILTEKGINYRSFYECIDFREELSQQECAVIEAELADMGLLDALVIPESQRNDTIHLLSSYSDSYIITDVNKTFFENKFFTINAPDELKSEIKNIIALFEEKTTLGTDGFYRNGILAGHVSGKDNACFIGAERRRQFRQKQIEKLTADTNNAESEYNNAKAQLDSVNNRLQKINDEYSKLPEFTDLNTAFNMLIHTSKELKVAEEIYIKNEEIYRVADSEFNKASAGADSLCREFQQYEKTVEFYNEVIEAVDDYYSTLFSIIDILKDIKFGQDILKINKEQIEELELDLDTADLELKAINRDIHEYTETIRLCNEFLENPEIADKANRAKEIDDSINELNKQIKECSEKVIICDNDIKHYRKEQSDLKSKLENLIAEKITLEEYFKEELELGFVFNDQNSSLKKNAETALKIVADEDSKRSIQEISNRLERVYRQNSNALSADYRPMQNMIFTDSDSDCVRARHNITLTWGGKQIPPKEFETEISSTIEHDKLLIKRSEEEMFKNILLNTISKKLYNRINESRKWVEEMSSLMQGINTSMGLVFSLSWKAKKDTGENEMQFDELHKLLNKGELISADDFDRLSDHFRSKIEHERFISEEQGLEINYTELVKNVMDFRNWFEFKIHYKEAGNPKTRELTNSRFNTFSGGERALSLYIPLFAAVAAQYKKAGNEAPMILALDEAFAGVDESNISEMFGLLEKLGFGYIVNSQALWGCYDTVPALEIAELCHEKDSDMITVIYYEWNGKKKILDDQFLGGII